MWSQIVRLYLVNISTVMEGGIDGRPAVEYLLESEDVPHPPGDLGQGEEAVVIDVHGSPQSSSAGQLCRSLGVGKVPVDLLPVNCLPRHLFTVTAAPSVDTGAYYCWHMVVSLCVPLMLTLLTSQHPGLAGGCAMRVLCQCHVSNDVFS